jgi:hypothetical protein
MYAPFKSHPIIISVTIEPIEGFLDLEISDDGSTYQFILPPNKTGVLAATYYYSEGKKEVSQDFIDNRNVTPLRLEGDTLVETDIDLEVKIIDIKIIDKWVNDHYDRYITIYYQIKSHNKNIYILPLPSTLHIVITIDTQPYTKNFPWQT